MTFRLHPLKAAVVFSLAVSLSATFSSAALHQVPAQSILSGEDLSADLGVLERAYSALHPGLLRYQSKAQMTEAFNGARARLASGATVQQAYLELALLSAKIRCGHTYPNFFNQPSSIVDSVFRGTARVPFYFTWIDGRMVVLRDLTANGSLPGGSEVLQINGIDTQKVLASLLPYIRADGANDAKRVALLGVNGGARWEAFDVYYPLLFPLRSDEFQLRVRSLGKAPVVLSVAAMTEATREAIRKSVGSSGSNAAPFSRQTLPSKAEIVRMPTWALYNGKWDWKTWLDEAFDQAIAEGAPKLILDLRGNEGGEDDIGRFILSRLIAQPLAIENYARLVRYRSAPTDLEPFLDTWDKSFLRLGAKAQAPALLPPLVPAGDWFALDADNSGAGTENINPRKQRYSGKVIVLVDSQNSSATFQFADAVQQNHLGLLLGEPTGGNQRGINGGAFFFLRLPHSKIEMDLPLIGYFAMSDKPDAGLRPDIIVRTTAGDIATGRDPQLLAADALNSSR